MIKCRVTPKTKRAEERVAQHGEVMYLIEERGNRFLVQSVGRTWLSVKGERDYWMDWFKKDEAGFSLFPEGGTAQTMSE